MIPVTYGIIKEIFSLNGETRISYGIACYACHQECGTASILNSVSDISSDEKTVSDIVMLLNQNELSLVHFEDVLEDVISA